MPNLNKVTLMGNLTRDPELKQTKTGKHVCDIGIAINEQWKDADGNKQESTVFVDVTFFGRAAEVIGEYCKKGRPLYVEGKLKLDTWEDKATGQQRSRLKVTGESFQFIGGRDDAGGKPSGRPRQQSDGLENLQGRNVTVNSGGADDGDEIPF